MIPPARANRCDYSHALPADRRHICGAVSGERGQTDQPPEGETMTLYELFMAFLGTAVGSALGIALVRMLGWNR